MYSIDDLMLFVKVVDIGSFLHTAKLLNITHPTVARKIKNLESNFGVTLLRINTREFELTEAGRQVYNLIKQQSGAVDSLITNLDSCFKDQSEPYGTIKVALPVALSYDLITPHLPKFLLKYPKINLVINYHNQMIDLVKDGYDLAILNYIPEQSGLKVKNVFNSPMNLYCTKAYAEKYGVPKDPSEISQHLVTGFMLADGTVAKDGPVTHNVTRVTTLIDMPKRIVINNSLHGFKLLQSNEVICGFFDSADPLLNGGDVIRVLPDYHVLELKFYSVRHQSMGDLKTQLFCDFLEECLKRDNSLTQIS